jgi:hypothetical protein
MVASIKINETRPLIRGSMPGILGDIGLTYI